ncbi:MAG: 50S ribosomal protein L4 [Candidatus Woesearchaeota archaeon]|nr:50S ribosomal protein L4 [Candidatus Woesearchaeota archaeon]
MKANLYDLTGNKIKSINLPSQFDEEFRPDLIKRAVLAIQSHKRQPYGALPKAGQRASALVSRRRRDYRTAYGHGISRTPRKVVWHRGRQFGWVGAFAPNTVGGRRAHPPKAQKDFSHKINDKERRKAIRSALAATCIKEIVEKRGHTFKEVPIIIDSKIENISKTKDFENVLIKLGLEKELQRIQIRKIRPGKGKARNRKYKTKKGPLIIVSEFCKLSKSAQNIPGIDIIPINRLNAELLAPGAMPGRLAIYTDKAIEKLEKENLFNKK